MKKALVCGAGGFIGSHLVTFLKGEGYWVRGVDQKRPEFSETTADDFQVLDLRDQGNCETAVKLDDGPFDEVYQLAADMGGMGFIHSAECEIMRNSALININMIHASAAAGVKTYFFSSSVCVYRDMKIGEPEMTEEQAYPAFPDNEYGWEKLYAERMAMAYGRHFGMRIRVARFQNCFGPEGTWQGGREKAPAAICRKVAMADEGGEVEVWGATAPRCGPTPTSGTWCGGIYMLTQSDVDVPVNIGLPEYVSVDELTRVVAEVAGKKITIKHVDGPVGVMSRNFANDKIYSTGWKPEVSLKEGIAETYPWILEQVKQAGLKS